MAIKNIGFRLTVKVAVLTLQRYLKIFYLDIFCIVCHTTRQPSKMEAGHATSYQVRRTSLFGSKV
jgi:hypothetical protein